MVDLFTETLNNL